MKYDEAEIRRNLKYLNLLSQKYPSIQAASTEIINLQAIMELPKGTEHFMSDLHGEYEAFIHIMNNASGEIRQKADRLYENVLTSVERARLATLVYYPEKKLEEFKATEPDMDEWYKITLHRLIDICRLVASKYSRAKVRRSLPEGYSYILDELLNTSYEAKEEYYEQIITTIIDIGNADDFIIALSTVIKRLVVDRLHIVGDLFDRGLRPDIIIDMLINHHAVDIQWGNHDVLWMGAAAGSRACIACVLNNSIKYGNLDSLEMAYGINLRPLTIFAQDKYKGSKRFMLKHNEDEYKSKDLTLMAKMYKAITVIQFKLEGQIILRHPEYHMEDRLLLDKMDLEKGTVKIGGKAYALDDTFFPTIDPGSPYELTAEEESVMRQLVASFENSYKLQSHVKFLYSAGGLYSVSNGNLMFHGCLPLNDDGTFMEFECMGQKYSGRKFFDVADSIARQAYYAQEGSGEKLAGQDFLWFLWCGRYSPLFGREKITTFERLFIDDNETWIEKDNAYYELMDDDGVCARIFDEFGLSYDESHIINGHVPVNTKKGESPIKAKGKIVVIDGGFCKAYQSKTGIAGYTLIYDSYGIRISSHEPFAGIQNAIRENKDIFSQDMLFEVAKKRLTVGDTDSGAEIKNQIDELKMLLYAYRLGLIKESANKPSFK